MSAATEAFCAAHFDYNGLTEGRRKAVRRALALYEQHAERPINETDAADLRAWMESLLAGGMHVNTVRTMGNCVRPWYRWAWRDARLIDAEVYMRVREVPNPRGATAQGQPRPYKRRDLDQFWTEFDARWPTELSRLMPRFIAGSTKFPRVSNYLMHVQIEAIVHLALHCGLRRNEIFTAAMDDIHPDNAYVVVRNGKGGKYREVPFTMDARRAVGEWFSLRSHVLRHFRVTHDSAWVSLNPRASMKNPLLPSTPAAPLGERRLKELMPSIGAWELHRFRHTCGTEWLRAGMPVERVQVLLGHSRIQQTMGYVQVLAQDVQQDARRHEGAFSDAVRRSVA